MKIGNNIEFDPLRRVVLVNGQILSWERLQNGRKRVCNRLSTKESELLEYLLQHKNKAVNFSELLENIWIDSNFNNKRSADVYINFLRKLLGKYIRITTLYADGWRLDLKNQQ
jgi:DNA-binding response OmpR family regulator